MKGSYILCPKCCEKALIYKAKMIVYMKLKRNRNPPSKPKKYKLCKICEAYLDMENFLNIHRYKNQDGYNTGSYTNCIVPCGYGMFALRFYKEQVIDKRRGI